MLFYVWFIFITFNYFILFSLIFFFEKVGTHRNKWSPNAITDVEVVTVCQFFSIWMLSYIWKPFLLKMLWNDQGIPINIITDGILLPEIKAMHLPICRDSTFQSRSVFVMFSPLIFAHNNSLLLASLELIIFCFALYLSLSFSSIADLLSNRKGAL